MAQRTSGSGSSLGPQRPAAEAQPPKKKQPAPPPIAAEVLAREKRIALQRNARREEIAEVVRAIVIHLGNEALIELAEAELAARNLAGPPKTKREGAPRRYTTYLPEALGARLNAHAKTEAVSPQSIVVRALELYLTDR